MLWLYLIFSLTLLVLGQGNKALQNERSLNPEVNEPNFEQIRSPMLEVLMHLPPNFRDVKSFRKALESPQRTTDSRLKRNAYQRAIVDVRDYKITQPVFLSERKNASKISRAKREAGSLKEGQVSASLEKPEKLVSSLTGVGKDNRESRESRESPVAEAIRGPIYTTHPVKEFDIVDVDDPEDPRRRRNDSDDPDDNSQRDKRTFLEEASGETTTSLPFWKRKKENPPFVTGRGGSGQSGSAYTPAQHRSGENARESHSLKNLEKSVQSNEISRSNHDNYYSATNRRNYGRQFDSAVSSTPKSVYDTFDYSSKRSQESGRLEYGRNQDSGRGEFGRNQEEKKETPRETKLTHEQYTNRQPPYSFPIVYDRPYYQPAYPYPTEVLGRGVEYYHRTYDPAIGRIIYYANMPEQARSYDYRYFDPISRNFYVNRPYGYDPYYRNFVPPIDHRLANGFGRSFDYLRNGRSGSQAYSYPYQDREVPYPRDAKYNGGFETANRSKDDFRNKTYIIYDADERRNQYPRPQFTPDNNRPAYAPPPNNSPSGPQAPFQRFPSPPPLDYFPPAAFPLRNQFYPSSPGPDWQFNYRNTPGITDTNPNLRPLNTPEVQLPLTTSSRGNLEKSKKS